MTRRKVLIYAGGGGSAEPVPYLVPSDWATKSLREEAEPAAELHPQSDLSGNLTKEVLVPSDWITRNLREEARALAFTMAEILLSLTIIGVVAAITLPSLTGNINERTWNTQRKALYARFSQAIALMPSLNGYGTLREETDSRVRHQLRTPRLKLSLPPGFQKSLKLTIYATVTTSRIAALLQSLLT